jgi:hypothetical protein
VFYAMLGVVVTLALRWCILSMNWLSEISKVRRGGGGTMMRSHFWNPNN